MILQKPIPLKMSLYNVAITRDVFTNREKCRRRAIIYIPNSPPKPKPGVNDHRPSCDRSPIRISLISQICGSITSCHWICISVRWLGLRAACVTWRRPNSGFPINTGPRRVWQTIVMSSRSGEEECWTVTLETKIVWLYRRQSRDLPDEDDRPEWIKI